MSIEMSCPSCASRLRVAAEHAGKLARCQKCGQTFVIAAPASEQPAPPAETVVAPTAVMAEPPKASMPVVEVVDPGDHPPRLLDEDNGRRPRRDRPRKAASSSAPWIMAACAAFAVVLVLFVIVVMVGGAATFAFFEIRRAEERVIVEVPPEDVRWDERRPQRDDKKFDQPEPIKKKDWPPQDVKKEEPKPAPKELPVAVAFKDGKFETTVRFDAGPDPQRISKEFQFTTKADTAYLIAVPNTTRAELRVTGPDGPVGPGDKRDHKQIAFLAAKAGTHSVIVDCFRFDAQPFKLTIKELDGSEPLPNNLKFPTDNQDLPTLAKAITLNVYDKQFTSAAFSPDNKFFWIAHGDSTLSRWENPGFERKGGYKTPGMRLFALCVDNQGRLYAQTGKGERGPVSIADRGISDINVYENLNPANETGALPAPNKRIPLAGIVNRMLHSPDGRWVYALDVHNRRLVRIDTQKGVIDKEVKNISTSTRSFCLTPDGKKIYCCSTTNRIDIIDPVEFKLVRSVSLDRSQPVDIGATNEGIVFLAGSPTGFSIEGGGNAYVVDLTGKPAERAVAIPFDMRVGNGTVGSSFVCMLPDKRGVFVSGDRAVVVVNIPARPALFQLQVRECYRESYNTRGQIVLSPDGRTLLYDTGAILSVSR
jgi:sugar lactone lactonase YvrE